jgi:hypothetical protein
MWYFSSRWLVWSHKMMRSRIIAALLPFLRVASSKAIATSVLPAPVPR